MVGFGGHDRRTQHADDRVALEREVGGVVVADGHGGGRSGERNLEARRLQW
jgi:hypothetical protein